MTKPIDPAYLALKRCVLALQKSPPRMIGSTLAYLLDRFIYHPPKPREKP